MKTALRCVADGGGWRPRQPERLDNCTTSQQHITRRVWELVWQRGAHSLERARSKQTQASGKGTGWIGRSQEFNISGRKTCKRYQSARRIERARRTPDALVMTSAQYGLENDRKMPEKHRRLKQTTFHRWQPPVRDKYAATYGR